MASYFSVALVALVAVLAVNAAPQHQHQQVIETAGALAADGQGWAADNHQEAAIATGIPGESGWGSESAGVPASILIASQGSSEVGNAGSISEITSNDGQGNLLGAQQIGVDQLAAGGNAVAAEIVGGDAALASSSDAVATGAGSSAAAGTLDILADQAGWGSSLGMAKP